jgi:hypothetical protein
MEIKIGNRTIPLVLTAYEMQDIQKDIGCTVGQLRDDVFAVVHHPDADTENGESEYTVELMKDAEKVRKLGTLIRIMGNAGLAAAGQKPDLTNEWLMENMDQYKLATYQLAVLDCMKKEDESQAKNEESEEKERDLVLEEIEQKKDPTN